MGKRKPSAHSPPKLSPSTSSGNHAKAPPAKDLSPATSTPASDASIVNPVSDLAAQPASSVPCSSTETLILKTVAPEFAAPAAEPASTPVTKSATFKAPASTAQTSRSGTNGGDLPVTDKPEFALAEPGVSLDPEPVMKLGVPVDDKAGELVDKPVNSITDNQVPRSSPTWCDRAKGSTKPLQKKGESFVLPSGEACIKIPNSIIEKNRKSWDCFVLGQFYHDPPSQSTIFSIVNGIWSRRFKDISVSKMEGNSFLFRIPNATTRHMVIQQKLWQIGGRTMFVDKWEPGVVPLEPELSSVPIWLELRKVPFQFFNEDGLERIAGLVGDPKFLHPSTANKTDLEVAKVWTIIDPRKPLPEAVNVQFESGEICRVLVSSPWMPPICEHCKEVGHSINRCKTAPITCKPCNSSGHLEKDCPKTRTATKKAKKTRRGRSKSKVKYWKVVSPSSSQPPKNSRSELIAYPNSSLGNAKDFEKGCTSFQPPTVSENPSKQPVDEAESSGVERDSSDVVSSDSEVEEGQLIPEFDDFTLVKPRKSSRKSKSRGSGPSLQ
ncbi:hypothetical protein BRARA_I04863 [Brassica rapa]|uniref:CCHC-type domain-containing protein n=1 Tax=Brassica campestris TaxID=3711 RepID=A0A397YEM8_BRACM|nr:hypothetical protein BRARA_I04863 [Brassica rapa]